ncbi:hypothetical protein BC628DRAFT_565782 [Trametes gibbosa]|nr:hypothetical protein BC628DRAFT_565782 [Trametes gibbosa]
MFYSLTQANAGVPRGCSRICGCLWRGCLWPRARDITAVASFDGTDASLTTFSYLCPEVTPNSAIYFYQFTSPQAPTAREWTTRFAIADAQGNTTPPPNAVQPDAERKPIPWGTGALKDPSKAVPEPGYLLAGGTGTTTASGNTTASATSGSTSASAGMSATDSAGTSSSSLAAGTTSDSPGSAESTSATTASVDTATGGATVTHTNTVTPPPAAPTSGGSGGNGTVQNGDGSGNGNNSGAALSFAARVRTGMLALGLSAVVVAVAF